METTRENYDALLEEVMREIPPKPGAAAAHGQGDVGSSAESPAGGIVCPGRPGLPGRALSDPAALRQFIETQARLGGESAANTLILMERYPKAARVHTFEEWKQMGRSHSAWRASPFPPGPRPGICLGGWRHRRVYAHSKGL